MRQKSFFGAIMAHKKISLFLALLLSTHGFSSDIEKETFLYSERATPNYLQIPKPDEYLDPIYSRLGLGYQWAYFASKCSWLEHDSMDGEKKFKIIFTQNN